MSPARSKRQAQVQRRERAEILKAVGVVAAIVIVTALLIWLLRPGPAGIPATGGLMNRQPRVSWLIGLAIGAGTLATWWILRRNAKAQARARIILPISLGVILAAVIIGGILWPGGLLRHDVAPATEPPATTTPTTTPAASATTAVTGTTVATPTTGATPTTAAGPTTAATPTTTATPTTAASPSTTGSP